MSGFWGVQTMRQPFMATVMLAYVVVSSMTSVVSGQDAAANARKAFEDAKCQHQSEVRRLALDAIGEIMPSLTRFTERQDFENLDKYIKMLALFSKSEFFPARLLPSPSVAAKFAGKRKDSARRVYEAYKTAGGISLDQPSNEPILVELQLEIKEFIEQERMLQSLEENAVRIPEELAMTEANAPGGRSGPKAKAPEDEQGDGKGVKGTLEIFKAFEELAVDISKELELQETSVLRQKAYSNSQKRIANFWKNKQLTFDCEVVDLSEMGRGYNLSFSYDSDSKEAENFPANLKTSVYLQNLDLKVEDVKPGRRFTMIVTVASSFRGDIGNNLVTLNTNLDTKNGPRPNIADLAPGPFDPRMGIEFALEIQRVSIVWKK
jgi:hypothetical protein